MGKPYSKELDRLADTYSWALEYELAPLRSCVRRLLGEPLHVVGSGGSFSAAHAIAGTHQRLGGAVGQPITPLLYGGLSQFGPSGGSLIVSAGGKNPDVLAALKAAITREAGPVVVLCGQEKSKLQTLASQYRSIDCIGVSLPAGKDGYLATNSLLAFAVLAAKAYQHVVVGASSFPERLDLLIGRPLAELRAQITERFEHLWSAPTLLVLYGASMLPAAIDLESKFVEAAIGNVQLADLRNFAHGRHLWLSRHARSTAVLALVSDHDARLAARTLALIPKSIPREALVISGEVEHAVISSLVHVLELVGAAAKTKGIDPGRPRVPVFGRKIYHLSPPRAQKGLSNREVAVARKRAVFQRVASEYSPFDWTAARDEFTDRLRATEYASVLLDYDGTLCHPADRFIGVSPEVLPSLTRILEAGARIAIVTGRGKSVYGALTQAVPPSLQGLVEIAYYNGGLIKNLKEGSPSRRLEKTHQPLHNISEILAADPWIRHFTDMTVGEFQITAQLKSVALEREAWDAVTRLIQRHSDIPLVVVRSSHSVDVLAPDVSKEAILPYMASRIGCALETPMLRIGDRGMWPGNDYAFLDSPDGLSVDELSADPKHCWNLGPPGVRGVQCTAFYLSRVEIHGGLLRIDLSR